MAKKNGSNGTRDRRMARKTANKAFGGNALARMIAIEVRKALRGTEKVMNRPIPGTGARVMYVAIPGKGKNREELTARAQEVLGFLNQAGNRHRATAADLVKGLKVNRNVIAGAIHELKQAGFVTSEAIES